MAWSISICTCISFLNFELDCSGSELVKFNAKNISVMETVVCLVCIAAASFAVLAQPAVAQGTNATLPLLIYPG